MEPQHKPIASLLQTMGILPLFNKQTELDNLKILQQLENQSYNWKVEDLDMDLIRGYYRADGRNVEQVLQTPYKNYCVAKIGSKYELFKIGCCYRPVVVPFKENPEVKQWFEQELGGMSLNN
jgi:hypothetical protein